MWQYFRKISMKDDMHAAAPGNTRLHMLEPSFFNRDSPALARALIGKVLRRRWKDQWLSARIIETEAYRLDDRGSHASLGYTHKRRALFMEHGGTIYMYYARGGDSFNVGAAGAGGEMRPLHRLCAGQTLLCRALALRVPDWDARSFDPAELFIDDVGESPELLIQTTRLGIPAGRDEHLPYRYVDPAYARYCTRNPLRRGQTVPEHYCWVDRDGKVVACEGLPSTIIPSST